MKFMYNTYSRFSNQHRNITVTQKFVMLMHIYLKKSDDTESESGYNDIEKKDNMLENLLILLNSAAAIGIGPQPEEFGKYEMRQKSASEMPGSKQGLKRG